eukprot:jgi/Mesvir1/2422/Mv26021-RA.1
MSLCLLSAWQTAIGVMLYKKGSAADPGNYQLDRGVCPPIQSAALKVFMRMMLHVRLRASLDPHLGESHAGGFPSHVRPYVTLSCIDQCLFICGAAGDMEEVRRISALMVFRWSSFLLSMSRLVSGHGPLGGSLGHPSHYNTVRRRREMSENVTRAVTRIRTVDFNICFFFCAIWRASTGA